MSGSWQVPEPLSVFKVRASGGASIFVRRHGNPNGPRMVLSHGNGFAIDAYYPFWSHFTGHFDVVVHDIRNHGWNPVGDRRAHNLPMFVDDAECIVREIDRRFGKKPRIGVFHSLPSMVALRQASAGGDGFSALVLFDPPVCPPGGFPEDMEGIGRKLCDGALRRKDRFDTPEAFAERLCEIPVFARMRPGAIDLFARATLRRAPDGEGYELSCPRECEARINEFIFVWSIMVDSGSVACPVKVIGADPTVPSSFMPSMDLSQLIHVDYDFVPETSHFLQFEEPERCAAMTLAFLEGCGLI